jgi:hypothetical protein
MCSRGGVRYYVPTEYGQNYDIDGVDSISGRKNARGVAELGIGFSMPLQPTLTHRCCQAHPLVFFPSVASIDALSTQERPVRGR